MEPSPDSDKNKSEPTPKPLNGALTNLLNNALRTSLKHDKTSTGVETRKCPQCSAARPDDTDLSHCSFCGYKFF
jgi:hypothetical protein